ncbi:MAG: FKBP-type peptidyl-prolyl cis-trans isomerase, partial [Cyclobacteriaceae bacterium]
AVLPILFFSCSDEDDMQPFTPPTHEEEVEEIETFLEDRNIAYQTDTSGMRYYLDSVGTGVAPVMDDTVSVRYTGFFPGGGVFDSNVDSGLPLQFVVGENRVIPGFEYAVMKLKEGGSGTFILPSRLAYGSTGAGPIPPYTIIGFEVELIDVR